MTSFPILARDGRRGVRPSTPEVRAEILASWQRSRLLGVDRENPSLPVESDLDPDSRLVRAAMPVLRRLYERFSGMPVTVVLTDPRANIVDRLGETGGLELMDAASLVPGANVDERFMGTSSVSMVLSTRAPFVVVGHEHFLHSLKTLTCMAAPVRDPVGGTVQGAVNLSVPMELARPGMTLMLQNATDRIGERLLEMGSARERGLMESFLRARRRGEHAEIDLASGTPARRGGAAPRLAPREELALLETATELISSSSETFAEVPLTGGRVATLRRKLLHHGDAEGAAVEISFREARSTVTAPGAPAAAAGGPNGRRVPLLRPPSPAGRPADTREETGVPGGAREEPEGPREAERGHRPGGTEGGGPDAWLLMVGEPGVGRLAVEARRRLSLLNEAGTRIGTTLDVRRTAEELAEITVPRFADVVVVDLAEDVLAGEEPPPGTPGAAPALHRVAVRGGGRAEGAPGDGADAPVGYAPGTPQARCLDAGRPVADSVRTEILTAPSLGGAHPGELLRGLLGEGEHSYLAAPLRARGAVLGLAGFYRRGRARPYEEDDLALAGELAARTTISVDNARRFSRERDAALTLQRSLLPRDTPRLAAVDLAHRYLPADARSGVGGDWFDAIGLSGMRSALVVGDVAGHGLEAAATMGRLRTAVRTLADLDLPPEEVLAHLDDLVGRAPDDPATAATCLYAVYDPVTCRCTAARAGHPPPVVVLPGGESRTLDLPAGPPLGLGGLQPYEPATVELPAGSLLALYTDGLLKEGRGYGDTEARTGLLTSALRGTEPPPEPSLERICDRVTGTLLPGGPHDGARDGPRDDVALLLARVHALPADRVASWELPSDPSVVSDARALARRQLDEWGLPELEYGTGLVVSELVTNAVRYGGGGPVRLRLLRGTSLLCEVSDRSNSSPRIRRAGVTEEGGRGLFLVAQFTRNWGVRYMPRGKTVWAEQVPHPEGSGSGRSGREEPALEEADEQALLAMFDDLG
ncbi:SpoIIE family protein phosphatase [Streptomyces pini]|uniref:SpoIIE family protein phosphatase n=1 Tax=Streptomyces pini TaxID=1520580 RepID=UPI001FE29C26|nr:SpoIIE family protein phosphatase [Streptomyces pini]